MKKFTKTLIFLLSVLCIVSVAGFAACQKEGSGKTDDVCMHDYKVISTVAQPARQAEALHINAPYAAKKSPKP